MHVLMVKASSNQYSMYFFKWTYWNTKLTHIDSPVVITISHVCRLYVRLYVKIQQN